MKCREPGCDSTIIQTNGACPTHYWRYRKIALERMPPKLQDMTGTDLFFYRLRKYLIAWAIVASFGTVLLLEQQPQSLDDF
jgi:hypothetical protein